MSPRNVYLVVEPMRPIAEDLALSVTDIDARAEILLASSESEALQTISDRPLIDLAIIHNGPQEFLRSALGAALAERGARIVLIGDRAEDARQNRDFPVLHRPYVPDEVMALVARMMQPPDKVSGG